MPFAKLSHRVILVFSVISVFAASASAQMRATAINPVTIATRPDSVTTRLETDPVVVSLAPADDYADHGATSIRRAHVSPSAPLLNQMIVAAIDARLGTPYRLGTAGPYRFDCSGFVWSVFQSAGIDFERSAARTLWSQFTPARGDERFQLGTLVFFNNLKHVGIVADEHGFYHASTSQGVTYSPFNEYWLTRVDGFRRVPQFENLAALKKPGRVEVE